MTIFKGEIEITQEMIEDLACPSPEKSTTFLEILDKISRKTELQTLIDTKP